MVAKDDETHRGIDGFHFNNTTSYVWWNTAYPTDALGTDYALAEMDGTHLLRTLVARKKRRNDDGCDAGQANCTR